MEGVEAEGMRSMMERTKAGLIELAENIVMSVFEFGKGSEVVQMPVRSS